MRLTSKCRSATVDSRPRGRLSCRHGEEAMIDWLFRNRQTGEMTVAQLPNAPLIVFVVAVAVRWIFHRSGTAGTIVSVVAVVALIVWAGDEIVRGVNPGGVSSVVAFSPLPSSGHCCI